MRDWLRKTSDLRRLFPQTLYHWVLSEAEVGDWEAVKGRGETALFHLGTLSSLVTGIETPGWNTSAAFFDADGDGWLDLYITRYIDCSLDDVLKAKPSLSWRGLEQVAFGPFGLKGAPDYFFRNKKGRFVEATELDESTRQPNLRDRDVLMIRRQRADIDLQRRAEFLLGL